MTKEEYDAVWLKTMLHSKAYHDDRDNPIKPLFWQQRKAELERKWDRELVKAVHIAKEMERGK